MKLNRLFLAAILLAATPILAQGQATKKLPIRPGTSIQKGEIYNSPSGNHELVLPDDGNLLVRSKDKTKYIWGINEAVGKDFPRSQVARAELRADGNIALFDAKQNLLGTVATFGGGAKSNLMMTVSFGGALQMVSGDQILWSSDGNLAPSIKVGLLKADITRTDSELKSNLGWDQCWVLKYPAIKIFATKNVSPAAINAVAVICDEMTKRLQPGLDGEKVPGSRFNGFKVYITNEEIGVSLKKLSGVKDFWTDGTGPKSRDNLLGGAKKTELWVTEQAICKTGIKTKTLIGMPPDTNTRTFDQVVHEFAHSIDMTFDLQKKDNVSTVFNGPIGPVEGFAIATQYWFGTPGDKLPDDQKSRLSKIFTSKVTFSPEGYGTPIANIKVGVADSMAKIRSLPSDKKLNVVWTNKTSGPVTLNWIDFKGIESPSKTPIQPGTSFKGETFVDHFFRVRDANGVEIRVIKVETTSGKLDILK